MKLNQFTSKTCAWLTALALTAMLCVTPNSAQAAYPPGGELPKDGLGTVPLLLITAGLSLGLYAILKKSGDDKKPVKVTPSGSQENGSDASEAGTDESSESNDSNKNLNLTSPKVPQSPKLNMFFNLRDLGNGSQEINKPKFDLSNQEVRAGLNLSF